jgi:pumilio homology domain family member 6
MANMAGNKRKAGGNSNYSDKNKKSKKPSKSAAGAAAVVDSNLSSSAQRRAVKHERQSHRRHADVVKDAKDLWNQLRLKTNTKEEIVPMMEKLMTLLYTTDTTLCEIALQHDASRVVQAAIQFANDEQRRKLCHTLQPQLPEMAKIQYAHFCVLKLIQYGHRDAECVKVMIKVGTGGGNWSSRGGEDGVE